MTTSGKPHSTIISILTSSLAVYLEAIRSSDFLFQDLVLESGHLCPKCAATDCAKDHGTWYRKIIHDLSTGEVFQNVPILRAVFCDGSTISLFPAELWRGKTTINSALKIVSVALADGIQEALQWMVMKGDGDDVISERTLRRLVKRCRVQMPLAAKTLNFSQTTIGTPAGRLENFLSLLHTRDLLALRTGWGFSILDIRPSVIAPDCSAYPRPGFAQSHPPQNPPSAILPRGTWSLPYRRGRPPDDQNEGGKS